MNSSVKCWGEREEIFLPHHKVKIKIVSIDRMRWPTGKQKKCRMRYIHINKKAGPQVILP